MENKKKFHGLLKVLLSLLFTTLFVCYSTSYATINEPFSADELTQINNFFNINISLTTLNNAYNYLKNHYSTLSKLNIIFVYGSDTQNGSNYLYLICNNGTFSSEIDYLKITSWSNTYFKITSVDNINSTTDLTFYYTRINTNTSYITGLESNNVLRIWTGENPPFTLNNMYFTSNRLLTTRNTAFFYAYTVNEIIRVVGSTNYIILDEYVHPEEPSGDIPISTGTITNPSGDITGQINLSGIENGITNVQNQISGDSQRIIDNQNQNTQSIVNTISGEVNKINNTLIESADNTINNTVITSGDIANTVDFSPINQSQEYSSYTNFWLNLLTGFSNAMTSVVRTLPVEFRGDNYIINLDDFTLFIPTVLKTFLTIVSSVFVCIYITRESKHIVEDIQTASIDNVANKLSEDFETNMF